MFWSFIIGYFFGSLSFGTWIPRLMGKGDPRTVGSGNTGATNVYRLAGIKSAVLVLIGDFLKSFLPVILLSGKQALLAGFAAVLGHVFPWMLKFRGGKGVATACGVMMALMPKLTLVALIVWVAVWRVTGYASVASLSACCFHLVLAFIFCSTPYCLLSLAITALIFYTHRHNLKRLWEGTEYKA